MINCCEKSQLNKEGGKVENSREKKHKKPFFANELWFREDEKELLQNKVITASVRVGDRTAETDDPKNGYREGRFVRIKIQKEDKEFDYWQTTAVVYATEKKTLGEIEPEDLEGTPLPQKTRQALIEKLKRLYGRDFTDNDVVTIVRFEYADDLNEAGDLIRTRTLAYAREPKSNPESLNFSAYTIPLIEHDYPAKTPVMWNAAYQEFGIDAGNIMLVGDPKQCGHILDVLRKDAKYKGGGAGTGFKDEVIPFLDEAEPLAKEIGAVNFVMKTSEGKSKGFNTDGLGYAQSLEEAFKKRNEKLVGKKAVVLGAGGAGNAIAFVLAEKGMQVSILNRTKDKAVNLAERINKYFGEQRAYGGGRDEIKGKIFDADVIIAVIDDPKSPLESYAAFSDITLPPTEENIKKNIDEAASILKELPRGVIISDIMIRKNPTATLREASNAGFETLDGIPMVINQGVEAFWLLYGEDLQAKNITKEQVAEVMKRAASS